MLSRRLSDVSHHDAGVVKLRITDGLEVSKYAALSHCWGKKRILCLTEGNLKEFCRGFAVSDLPKTFRDAIEITSWLGIQYLWIDSLTIKQDSPEDWAIEATRMGQIYWEAFCNISALGSGDSSGGLFHDRKPTEVTPFRIPASWTDFPQKLLNEVTNSPPRGSDDFLDAPLLDRAWVYQERCLARRIIHFGRKQL